MGWSARFNVNDSCRHSRQGNYSKGILDTFRLTSRRSLRSVVSVSKESINATRIENRRTTCQRVESEESGNALLCMIIIIVFILILLSSASTQRRRWRRRRLFAGTVVGEACLAIWVAKQLGRFSSGWSGGGFGGGGFGGGGGGFGGGFGGGGEFWRRRRGRKLVAARLSRIPMAHVIVAGILLVFGAHETRWLRQLFRKH